MQTRSAKNVETNAQRKMNIAVLTMKSTILWLASVLSTDFGATRMMVSGVMVSGSVKILMMALAMLLEVVTTVDLMAVTAVRTVQEATESNNAYYKCKRQLISKIISL